MMFCGVKEELSMCVSIIFSYILLANSKIVSFGIHPFRLAATFALMKVRLIVLNCYVCVLWHSMKAPLIRLPLSLKQLALAAAMKGCPQEGMTDNGSLFLLLVLGKSALYCWPSVPGTTCCTLLLSH